MDKKTQGAWIVHHAEKLRNVTHADNEFEQINFAGKCGVLLSSLSANQQQQLTNNKVAALAKAANINARLELPAILTELERQHLISSGSGAIEVLGLSSSKTLEHASRIFDESSPDTKEIAAIELSELCSELPHSENTAKEFISDKFSIASQTTNQLFQHSECIGFIDAESAYGGNRLLFNGNLFRNNDVNRSFTIINSFSSADSANLKEVNDLLEKDGCINALKVKQILGEDLFSKAHSIALFDVNTVGNEQGSHEYVTKPSAFNKFSSSTVDDAFDLAKAFVSSLTYGMTQSQYGRGRIQMINLLMTKMINGNWVGPATAIGQDYQILELKGVVQTEKVVGNRYRMKLLKKEVGELALKVINEGDVSQHSLNSLPGASVTSYRPPEVARQLERKNQTPTLKQNIGEILSQLRTGNV